VRGGLGKFSGGGGYVKGKGKGRRKKNRANGENRGLGLQSGLEEKGLREGLGQQSEKRRI